MRQPRTPHHHGTDTCKVTAMNGISKLRALGLALGMVANAASTGWTLQLPLTAMTADVGTVDVPAVTMPAVPLSAEPQSATQADGGTPVHARAASTSEAVGLEARSATGATTVQR